jgi:hypothetical protein
MVSSRDRNRILRVTYQSFAGISVNMWKDMMHRQNVSETAGRSFSHKLKLATHRKDTFHIKLIQNVKFNSYSVVKHLNIFKNYVSRSIDNCKRLSYIVHI